MTSTRHEKPSLADAARQSGASPWEGQHDVARELNWLRLNRRTLGQASNGAIAFPERLARLASCSTNIDEFLAGTGGEIRALLNSDAVRADDPLRRGLESLWRRARQLLADTQRCFAEDLWPAFAGQRVAIERTGSLGPQDRAAMKQTFVRTIESILTPLSLNRGRSFPVLGNLTMNVALQLVREREIVDVVVLRLPDVLSRFVPLRGARRFALLEDVILANAEVMFPSLRLHSATVFRIIRASGVRSTGARRSARGLTAGDLREIVLLQIEEQVDARLLAALTDATACRPEDVLFTQGPLQLRDFFELPRDIDISDSGDARSGSLRGHPRSETRTSSEGDRD